MAIINYFYNQLINNYEDYLDFNYKYSDWEFDIENLKKKKVNFNYFSSA